jgi:phage recombination protein Bet
MSNAEIVKHPSSATIQKPATFEFSPEQRKMIRDSFLSGASEQEAEVLMELARLRRLNPITQQIHFVQRWNSQRKAMVWAAQVGIDGFRAIAERTGNYDGQDEAEFEYDAKGNLKLARVRVYRRDWSRPAVGVAHFSEYAQTTKEKQLTHMWASKPHVMLSKCAEALAFRKAFPEDTSGLYAPEEMPEQEAPATRAPPPAARVVVQAKAEARSLPPPEAMNGAAEAMQLEAHPLDGADVLESVKVSPTEQALIFIEEAPTLHALAALTEKIVALGVAKEKPVRDAYAAKQASLKRGAA